MTSRQGGGGGTVQEGRITINLRGFQKVLHFSGQPAVGRILYGPAHQRGAKFCRDSKSTGRSHPVAGCRCTKLPGVLKVATFSGPTRSALKSFGETLVSPPPGRGWILQ